MLTEKKSPQYILRMGSHAERSYIEWVEPLFDVLLLNANLVEGTPAASLSLVEALDKKPSHFGCLRYWGQNQQMSLLICSLALVLSLGLGISGLPEQWEVAHGYEGEMPPGCVVLFMDKESWIKLEKELANEKTP